MASSGTPDQIFVGGTGRCGTHAIGHLLGRHRRYKRVHTELRFHADPYGLPGLLRGAVELDDYLANLRGRWWKRTSARGHEQGLFNRIPEDVFKAEVADFEAGFPDDPWGAGGKLIHGLIDPQSGRLPGWVELTKRNVQASPVLCQLLPECKIIHMIRDGRDSASSVTQQAWGSGDLGEALTWWETRLSSAEQASNEIPAERLLVVDFQDFVSEAREETYDRLLEFTGTTSRLKRIAQFRMRQYYAKSIARRTANIERWREGLSEEEQVDFTEQYSNALERLIAADSPGRPLFERWLARAATD